MKDASPSQLELDWSSFDPWRIQPLRHRLIEHPLLQPDQLVALGARLEVDGRVRTHSNDAEAGTPFNTAPRLHPNRRSATDTLEHISEAKAWMSLLNVQTDDIYRKLVDAVLDEVRAGVDSVDPGMCYRGGWIFVTSPRTVTPFHYDKEHNFILQIRGRKTLHVWDHRDEVAASEASRDRFHARHERDLLVWNEALRERAQTFELEPGMGAYMPSTSPHMVENGDEPSITMSFTYYTDSTRRDSLLHRAHYRLSQLGLKPPPVARHAAIDGLLHATLSASAEVRNRLLRMLGRTPHSDRASYAYADVY
ncbi:MAG TPA: cupin-like domain-containing protein [Dokdonella sp.]|uniref:cupin-like domain-containing protein n=1 Tax=Dokdonella sp. TaxID=2291710 RepID=UPI002D80E29A|nr:cupin-like domain-containing protein [Dokdonella sp.]HET9032642.1 cupin-like domain-containing protein [Dokdonella sp.]